MSQFAADMAASGAPELLRHLGTPGVVYTEPGEEGVSLTAIVGPVEGQADEEGEHGDTFADHTREVTVSTDPTGEFGGVAAPRRDAWFTIDTVEWAIQSVVRKTASLTTLRCVSSDPVELGRPGYRG